MPALKLELGFQIAQRLQSPETIYPKTISGSLQPNWREHCCYSLDKAERTLTFTEDVIRANFLAAVNNAQGVYRIGSGKDVTINQLAKAILNLAQKDLQPVHEAARPGDPRHTLSDISKASGFGYEPEWTPDDGFGETIQGLKQ